MEVGGPCPWDGETSLRPVVTGADDDVASITSGKDFALLRTHNGRVRPVDFVHYKLSLNCI